MVLLCCSFASASFTSRNPSSLSVDHLNSKIYTIFRASLIATHPVACPRNDLRRKTLDRGCPVSLDFFWQVLPPQYPVPSPPALPCCRFLETLLVATACSCYFLCQAWQTWACFLAFVQRACFHPGASKWSGGQPWLLLPFLRSLFCWCDRVFHPPDRQCSHLGPLALFCTADTLLIASCLFWSENSGWLLAYFLPPPSPIVSFAAMDFFVTQILPKHKPSCILSQHEVCYPCTVERLVDASPFFLLPSPWYKSVWNPPHPSMYHAVEPLPYSDHSLHQLVIFVCWSVSKLLTHDPGACAPPLLLILV